MLPFDAELAFAPGREEFAFADVPSRPGVFRIRMRAPAPVAEPKPYLARTADLRRAAERLLRVPETASKRLNLREVAAAFSYRVTGSRFEQSLMLYEQARLCFPNRLRGFLRLRPPALLKINLRNAYPRCYVTRRLHGDSGFYFGPFVSRKAAQSFAESFLDLFKIRRCQIKIRRDPNFPGCIYSEMNMCLAPCFAGCSKEGYDQEVRRVLEALDTAGESLGGTLEREREAASGAMEFERAGLLHKKLEKVNGVFRSMPELARRVDKWNAVVLQSASRENTVAIFPVVQGLIAEALFLSFDPWSREPRSAEAVVRRHLEALGANAGSRNAVVGQDDTLPRVAGAGLSSEPRAPCAEREEHLWLLARWFYSRPREGEILYRETDWPYRRILRACARVLAAAKPTPSE